MMIRRKKPIWPLQDGNEVKTSRGTTANSKPVGRAPLHDLLDAYSAFYGRLIASLEKTVNSPQ